MRHFLRLLAKTFAVALLVTAYVALIWGASRSSDVRDLFAVAALVLSLANLGLLLLVWVFVLAKHLSTHTVKMMDIGEMIRKEKKFQAPEAPSAPGAPSPELEVDWAKKVAEDLVGRPGRKKESLTDHLS